jgi:membrane-associated phospholipid phosphatase
MYLGVHYPSDVLAGVVIGTVIAVFCFMAKNKIKKRMHNKEFQQPVR